jgi:hypothetical protein
MGDTPLTDAVLEQARTWETVTYLTDHARQMERDRTKLIAALRSAAGSLDNAGNSWAAGCAYTICDEVEASESV